MKNEGLYRCTPVLPDEIISAQAILATADPPTPIRTRASTRESSQRNGPSQSQGSVVPVPPMLGDSVQAPVTPSNPLAIAGVAADAGAILGTVDSVAKAEQDSIINQLMGIAYQADLDAKIAYIAKWPTLGTVGDPPYRAFR